MAFNRWPGGIRLGLLAAGLALISAAIASASIDLTPDPAPAAEAPATPTAEPSPTATPLPPLPHDISAQAIQTPYRNGVPFLDQQGYARIVIGAPSVPLAGDWHGSGSSAPGVFEPAPAPRFLGSTDLRGHALLLSELGAPGDLPLTGDWDSTGRTRLGVFRPGAAVFLIERSSGVAEFRAPWMQPDDVPVAGRWQHGSGASVGLFRPATGEFLLLPTLDDASAPPVILRVPAQPGDQPVTGDWNGSGIAQPAVYRAATGELIITNRDGAPLVQQAAPPGTAGTPVAGHWHGPGPDTLALARPGPPPNFWHAPAGAPDGLRPLDTVALAEGFFPVGIYAVDSVQHFPTLKAAGFNAVLPWQTVNPSDSLRAADTAGLKLAIYATNAERDRGVRPWAIYLADEPYGGALAGRLPPDEVLARLQQRRASLLGRAPLHFLTETSNGLIDPRASPATWAAFARVADAAAVDNYPKSKEGQFPNLGGVGISMRALATALGGTRPAWFVPQTHAFSTKLVLPTPEDERAMVYTALVHGASGIFYFAWDSFVSRDGLVLGIRPDPQPTYPRSNWPVDAERLDRSRLLWESIDASRNGLNAELAGLREVLLSPTSALDYRVRASLPAATPSLRTLLKQQGNRLWLLAVNLAPEPVQAQVSFEVGVAASRPLIGPDAPVAADGRTLPFTLGAGGAGVLELDLAP